MNINTQEEEINLSINENIESYESLIRKPKINNIELSGNKSLQDLGIEDEINNLKTYTDNKINSLYTNSQIDEKDETALENAKSYTDSQVSDKTSKTYVDNKDASTLADAKDYTDTEISELDIPTKTSDLTNDSGFITSAYHDSAKADASTVSAIDTRLTEAESDISTKLDKPTAPTEKSAVTIDTDGTVGTYPLSETWELIQEGTTEESIEILQFAFNNEYRKINWRIEIANTNINPFSAALEAKLNTTEYKKLNTINNTYSSVPTASRFIFEFEIEYNNFIKINKNEVYRTGGTSYTLFPTITENLYTGNIKGIRLRCHSETIPVCSYKIYGVRA